MVSGDSRGKTSFWNGKIGTLVDSYQTHKADVLAVAVSKDQQVFHETEGIQITHIFSIQIQSFWYRLLNCVNKLNPLQRMPTFQKENTVTI